MSNLTIWKFPLLVTDVQEVEMPRGAEPLFVEVQNEIILCLWCKVLPEAQKIKRLVFVHGTGHPIDARAKHYAGSTLMFDGQFVWHVFLEEEQ